MTADSPGDVLALDAKRRVAGSTQAGCGAIDDGLLTYVTSGRQFIAVAAADNNPTVKVMAETPS